MNDIEQRLADLQITLPKPAAAVANYVGWVKSGDLVFTAGQITLKEGKFEFQGKLGQEFTIEQGQQAARLCAINVIAQIKAACDGDLGKVKRIVKLVVFVNSAPDFIDQPKVANGASDLMVDVFAEKGRHARSAVGAASLPANVAVEVEAVVEIEG